MLGSGKPTTTCNILHIQHTTLIDLSVNMQEAGSRQQKANNASNAQNIPESWSLRMAQERQQQSIAKIAIVNSTEFTWIPFL